MRILHFIYDDIHNPWCGGGGAYTAFEIYKKLARRHEITIITGNYPGAKRTEIREGIVYRRVGSNKNYLLSRLTYSLNAWRYVRHSEFDILVDDFSPFSPSFANFLTNRRIASVYHLQSVHAFRKYGILGIIPWFFERLNLRISPIIIVLSPSVAMQIKERIHSLIQIIPAGVDGKLFSIVPYEEPYILYLGRINIYNKGLDILIEAFSLLVKLKPELYLVIAGGGNASEFAQLQEIIDKHQLTQKVKLLGRINNETKISQLSGCLFVCMPSRYEGWGIVAIEAGAAGKPVIASNIQGLSDSVKDGETGLLFPSNDAFALFQKMLYLVKHKEERIRLGQNGRLWAKNFNWDAIALKREQLYLKFANLNNRRLLDRMIMKPHCASDFYPKKI